MFSSGFSSPTLTSNSTWCWRTAWVSFPLHRLIHCVRKCIVVYNTTKLNLIWDQLLDTQKVISHLWPCSNTGLGQCSSTIWRESDYNTCDKCLFHDPLINSEFKMCMTIQEYILIFTNVSSSTIKISPSPNKYLTILQINTTQLQRAICNIMTWTVVLNIQNIN